MAQKVNVHVSCYLKPTIKSITTDIITKQAATLIPDGFCDELYCILLV